MSPSPHHQTDLDIVCMELCVQGNTYIRQLDDDDIAGMRVACKLGREVGQANTYS